MTKKQAVKARAGKWGRRLERIPKNIKDHRLMWLWLDGKIGDYNKLRKAGTPKGAALKELGMQDDDKARMVITKARAERAVEQERLQYVSVQPELKEMDKITREVERVAKIVKAEAPEADRSDLPDDLAWVYDHPLLLKAVQQPDKPVIPKEVDLAEAPSRGARSMLSMALAEPKWLLDKVLKHMMDRDKKAAPDKDDAPEDDKELTPDDIQLEEIEAMLKGVK